MGCAGKCEGKSRAIAGGGWREGFKTGFAAAISFGRDFAFREGADGALAGGCGSHEKRGTVAGGADRGLRADFAGGPEESGGGGGGFGMARDGGAHGRAGRW